MAIHYDLSELENLNDGFGGFIEVKAWDDEGHETSIITNRAGEGRWERYSTPLGVEYKQKEGTLQFQLGSDAQIKALLRKELQEKIALGYYEMLAAQEAQLREIRGGK